MVRYSLQAVREAIRQARPSNQVEIHVLNVQPRIFSEETLNFMPVEKIDTCYFEWGGKALAPAEKLLLEARLPFVSHRLVGPVAETILEKQRELGCDSIVMSTQGTEASWARLGLDPPSCAYGGSSGHAVKNGLA